MTVSRTFSNFNRALRFWIVRCPAFAFVAVLSWSSVATADTSWISSAEDCPSFEKGLRVFQSTVDPDSPTGRQEMEFVTASACEGKFKVCGLALCKKTADPSRPHNNPLAPAIVTDPLAWLRQPMDCDQLSEQISARYAPLGGISQLNDQKRQELRKVLDEACSERFRHCNFTNCSRLQPTDLSAAGKSGVPPNGRDSVTLVRQSPEERVSVAEEQLRKLIDEYQKNQRKLIDAKVADEQQRGVIWQPVQMPDAGEEQPEAESDRQEQRPSAVSPGIANDQRFRRHPNPYGRRPASSGASVLEKSN